jgi:hypothetical protein
MLLLGACVVGAAIFYGLHGNGSLLPRRELIQVEGELVYQREFTPMEFGLLAYQLVPFAVLWVVFWLSRSPKRAPQTRNAGGLTFWAVLGLSVWFYGYLICCTFSRGAGDGAIVFLLAPLWSVGIIVGLWLVSWVFFWFCELPPIAKLLAVKPEAPYEGPRCVSCRSPIAADIELCPKCGYTQPTRCQA